jgi:uncharacterized protein YecT (DUF1311 family)
MRAFTIAISLASLLITSIAEAQDAFEWKLEQELEFIDFHDPGTLVLRNEAGEQSELDFGYQGLSYAVVSAWPKGKEIRLTYSPEHGTAIIDPESDERYTIRQARPRLAEIVDRCLAERDSTLGKQACYAEAVDGWDVELNRAYQALMKGGLSQETKGAIRTAQRQWIEFRDASNAATTAVVAEQGGSVRTLQAGAATVALTRSQALKLWGYLH